MSLRMFLLEPISLEVLQPRWTQTYPESDPKPVAEIIWYIDGAEVEAVMILATSHS